MPRHHRRYPWPASQIDRDIMHELHLASRETGHPITTLIAEAVHTAMTQRLDQRIAAAQSSNQDSPSMGFRLAPDHRAA